MARMRRFVAIGCCIAYLAFGFVAGAAHVHETTDHPDSMPGLHLGHAHLGPGHPHHHHHPAGQDGSGAANEKGDPGRHAPGARSRLVASSEDDALYLSVTAQRSLDPGSRLTPARVAMGATIDPSTAFVPGPGEEPASVRGPPTAGPSLSRAPPA